MTTSTVPIIEVSDKLLRRFVDRGHPRAAEAQAELARRAQDLDARIRARLDDPVDVALNGTPYVEAIRNVLAEADKIEATASEQPGMYLVGKAIADQFRNAIAAGLGITGGTR
jgi:hypothetical protein